MSEGTEGGPARGHGKVMTAQEAVADIPDGASIALSGFGVSHRYPSTLITALRAAGAAAVDLVVAGGGHNYRVALAKASGRAIVDDEELVPAGAAAPADGDQPRIFGAGVVPEPLRVDLKTLQARANRTGRSARSY